MNYLKQMFFLIIISILESFIRMVTFRISCWKQIAVCISTQLGGLHQDDVTILHPFKPAGDLPETQGKQAKKYPSKTLPWQ